MGDYRSIAGVEDYFYSTMTKSDGVSFRCDVQAASGLPFLIRTSTQEEATKTGSAPSCLSFSEVVDLIKRAASDLKSFGRIHQRRMTVGISLPALLF